MSSYFLSAADVREIAAESGLSHAEMCVEQAETQCDVSDARAELNRLLNEEAINFGRDTDGLVANHDA